MNLPLFLYRPYSTARSPQYLRLSYQIPLKSVDTERRQRLKFILNIDAFCNANCLVQTAEINQRPYQMFMISVVLKSVGNAFIYLKSVERDIFHGKDNARLPKAIIQIYTASILPQQGDCPRALG